MTVTTTAIGNNTVQIAISAELNSAAIIIALDAAIVAAGWTQYDSYNSGAMKVYRSLNKDNTTYKYLWVYVDVSTLKITTSSFEFWNASTHTGTNETQTYSRAVYSGYNLFASDIVLMVNNRWCVIQSFIRGSVSPWHGVFEIQREAAEDTAAAGFPCWAWMSSVTPTFPSLPRTRGNLVGSQAVANGLQTPYLRLTDPAQLSSYIVYPWDSSKRIVHSLRPTVGLTEVHGRMYGLKSMYNIGNPYSRISVPVDSEMNYLNAGTQTEHWLLGGAQQAKTSVTSPFSTSGPSNFYATVNTSVDLSSVSYQFCYTGQFYYIAHATGVAKLDAGPSLSLLTSLVVGTSGFGAIHDIVFDGRYVYASTTTGLIRIDPATDTVTALALTNGCSNLFWDGTWLWAGARGTRIGNSLYKVDPATFTLSATVTLPNTTTSTAAGMCIDASGNLYVTITGASDNPVYKVVIATNAASAFIPTTGPGLMYGASITFDGNNLVHHYGIAASNFIAYYSTSGVLQATALSQTANNNPNPSLRGSIARFGNFIFAGTSTTTVATNSAGAFPVLGSSGLSSSAFTPGSYNTTAMQCDGARLMSLNGLTGALSIWSGLTHPDDPTTPTTLHGRFLLPK